eukprot:CAMPEP_0174262646 /NCGR_PEP_ID=MMETSP0439-20130205/14338_1 /TAXON_ID=0 /ORGANISM="Stereomyxa ramosa, Strain Chinc5" /LENGTH=387 /DNA_ID=CAMNT_0015347475 /DNA_START=85 /DNA_END=1248 /DNA_ORIENTATION=+
MSSIVGAIPKESRQQLFASDHPKEEIPSSRTIGKQIQATVEDISIKIFVEALHLHEMEHLLRNLDIDHETKNNNPRSKRVLDKRLKEQMRNAGLLTFLQENATSQDIVNLAESFEIQISKKRALEDLVDGLQLQGMSAYLSSFPLKVLRDMVFDMKLTKDEFTTASKTACVTAIIHGENIKDVKVPREVKPIKFSKKRQPIKRGITYDDIFQHYTLPEMQEWCRENGLKVSGNRKTIIKRILAFLDGDKENTLATQSTRGRRSGSKKKSSPAPKKVAKRRHSSVVPEEVAVPEDDVESESESESEQDVEEQVEEEVEEEIVEEVPEEEMSDDEEEPLIEDIDFIDLDRLSEYSLQFLKDYCKEEALTVKGKRKADYVRAIEAYNDDV